jgi:hypothetical protein
VVLSHAENEGTRKSHRGLQQWKWYEANGEFWIRRPAVCLSVTRRVSRWANTRVARRRNWAQAWLWKTT